MDNLQLLILQQKMFRLDSDIAIQMMDLDLRACFSAFQMEVLVSR